jgi:hypothetical protein
LHTGITGGAGVSIITGIRVGRVQAPGRRIAAVIGARIVVVAVWRGPDDALFGNADIPHGTNIVVGARLTVGGIDTAEAVVTTVIGAGVAIITLSRGPPGAAALDTDVIEGTGVSIITGLAIGRIHTSTRCVTAVVGTRIVVVTLQFDPWNTHCGNADIPHGARIVVGTVIGIGRDHTAQVQVAAVITAGVAFVTACIVGLIDAPAGRVAGVIGAGHPIIAI